MRNACDLASLDPSRYTLPHPVSQPETGHTDSETVAEPEAPVPGVVLLYAAAAPRSHVFALDRGAMILGRDTTALVAPDSRMSKRHAEIRFDHGHWAVRDLESRNGTFINGSAIPGNAVVPSGSVLRLADSIFLLAGDSRPFFDGISSGDVVAGPAMRDTLRRIEYAGACGRDVLITGETGTGKEIAARAFRAASKRAALPMVTVNCANLPEGLAERLLFGALRGAYSGANTNSSGLLAEAHQAVLFLDEVAELDVRASQAPALPGDPRNITTRGNTEPHRRRSDLLCHASGCVARHRRRTHARRFRPAHRAPAPATAPASQAP